MTKPHLDRTAIIVAIIAALAAIIGSYWQFVWKPDHPGSSGPEYAGRVLDSGSAAPVKAAKVSLEVRGSPPIIYTDSEGIFRFSLAGKDERVSGHIVVEAAGYERYDRFVTLTEQGKFLEDVRLARSGSQAGARSVPPLRTKTVEATVSPASRGAKRGPSDNSTSGPILPERKPAPTETVEAPVSPGSVGATRSASAQSDSGSARPHRAGGTFQQAVLIHKFAPAYPPLAKQARIQGTVTFEATIGKNGRLQNLTLIAGDPHLVPAAADALKRWLYTPALLNGEPIEVNTQVDINFTLSQ